MLRVKGSPCDSARNGWYTEAAQQEARQTCKAMKGLNILITLALVYFLAGCGGGGGQFGDNGGDLSGYISSDDWVLGDGYYADRYSFTASRDGWVQVDMTSGDLDPYLLVIDDQGNALEDDDSGNGDDARLEFYVYRGRDYEIRATTYDRYDTGKYHLYWSKNFVYQGELRGRAGEREQLPAPKLKPKPPVQQ